MPFVRDYWWATLLGGILVWWTWIVLVALLAWSVVRIASVLPAR